MFVNPAGSGKGYQIANSVRFRSSASASFGRTPSNGDRTRATISCWLKRGKLGVAQHIYGSNSGLSGSFGLSIGFNASDQLEIQFDNWNGSSGYANALTSTAVYRDPTAHLHLTVAIDTNVASFASSVVCTINGSTVSMTAGSPTGSWTNGYQIAFNSSAYAAVIGARYGGPGPALRDWFDGEISEFNFIGGSAVSSSSFGQTDPNNPGNWIPKKYADSYSGTNSCYLKFNDGTSATTLGYDRSGNGNNWTASGISTAAGVTYDWLTDTPTNNYATLNPIIPSAANISYAALRSGTTAVQATQDAASFTNSGAYWEVTAGGSAVTAGLISGTGTTNTTTVTANKVFGFRLVSGALSYINITDAGSWTSITTGLTGQQFPYGTSQAADWNFGQRPFSGTPSGQAICTANLPAVAIPNPSQGVAHRYEAGSGIASAIATDRGAWSAWVELFKRGDTSESWKVRFSDDSSNMMAFDTNAAKAAWSAPSAGTYLGVALRAEAVYGCVTGTYAGNNTANRNISHSLGVAPTCGIVKNESTGSWYVWHTKMTGATYFTTLNSATPPAQSATNTPWGTGNWSSTQFMVTNDATNNLNANSNTYRYILFSDISGLLALLGFTGNGSADGAFEYAKHRPQLQIEKDLAATTGFYVFSDKIDTYNVTATYLLLNTNAGTAAATGVDIVSNGIKHRSTTVANASDAYSAISIGRQPFGGSNISPACAR